MDPKDVSGHAAGPVALWQPSTCLNEELIAGFVGGVIDTPGLAVVEAHLARCPTCRGLVAAAGFGALESTIDTPAGAARWQVSARAGGESFTASRHAGFVAFRPGDLLAGKYRIEERLGRGGMGEVFAARHEELGHRVAIKILHIADPKASARFLREARTCARLTSEHIVRVFDVGRVPDGPPYMVMECLAGQDLAQVITTGRLAVSDAVHYVLQACAAVAEAHAAGVVHRDLKPANLFLATRKDAAPCIKVLDFGISKFAADDLPESLQDLTATGAILGSPQYMSPEQIRADKDLDARTDVWSLGVILYELVTRRVPFRAPALSALSVAIATEVPAPPSSIEPGVPPALERAILRCLEKDRAARFPSMQALAAALASLATPHDEMVAPGRDFADQHEAGRRQGGRPRSATFQGLRWPTLGLILAVGSGAAIVAVRRRETAPAPTPSATSARSGERPTPVAPAMIPEGHAEPPATIDLMVRGAPPGAQIWHDGKAIGGLPGPVALPFAEAPVRVTVSAAGYESTTLTVTPNRALEVAVELRKRTPEAPHRPSVPRDLESPF